MESSQNTGSLRGKPFSSVSLEEKQAHCDSPELSYLELRLPEASSQMEAPGHTHTFCNFPFCFPLFKSRLRAGTLSGTSLSLTAPSNIFFYRADIASPKMWLEKQHGPYFLFQMPRLGASWLRSNLLAETNFKDVEKRAQFMEQSWRAQLSSADHTGSRAFHPDPKCLLNINR